MKNLKYRMGFTLIELLAVIVILALLVLVATPAITRIMTNSQKNSFRNEAVSIVGYLEDAFTEKMNKKVKSTETTLVEDDSLIWNVSDKDNVGYAYLCMSLNQLLEQQYMKKNLGENYGGYVQMWVPDGKGETITYINLTNGRYFIQGKLSQISDSDYSASQSASSKIKKPTQDITCPEDAAIPDDDAINNYDNGEPQVIETDDDKPTTNNSSNTNSNSRNNNKDDDE